jgi:hypothetical protein
LCDFRRKQFMGTLAAMPPAPPRKQNDPRRGQLVQRMLWGGVALAPLAVLILLFGSSTGSLRFAVILITFSVTMIAISVALRPSLELVRADIEERVLDEVDAIRARAREDVTTAARNTHRALTGQIHEIGEAMEDMRNQLIEMQAQQVLLEQQALPSDAAAPGGPGMVRRTETVHVTRRTTTVGGDDQTGTVYGSKSPAAVEGEWHDREDWDAGAGDRYASVRSDERGREMRVGERRATVRQDDRGSELRVEDRWASLRRDDDRRDEPRRAEGYGEADWEATFRSLSASPTPTPALPAGRERRAEPDQWESEDWTKLGGRGDDGGTDRGREHERESHSRGRGRERGREEREYDDRGYGPRHDDDRRDRDYPREDAPRRDDRPRDDRPRDDRPRDDRPRDDRGRDDPRYDDRPRDDRGRDDPRSDDRRRDERGGYDDRGRDERGGYDDRGRDDRAYDDRRYDGRDDRPYPPRPRRSSEYDR